MAATLTSEEMEKIRKRAAVLDDRAREYYTAVGHANPPAAMLLLWGTTYDVKEENPVYCPERYKRYEAAIEALEAKVGKKLNKWLQVQQQFQEGASEGQPDWIVEEQAFGIEQTLQQLQEEVKESEQ